jgi:hypothetical protein
LIHDYETPLKIDCLQRPFYFVDENCMSTLEVLMASDLTADGVPILPCALTGKPLLLPINCMAYETQFHHPNSPLFDRYRALIPFGGVHRRTHQV